MMRHIARCSRQATRSTTSRPVVTALVATVGTPLASTPCPSRAWAQSAPSSSATSRANARPAAKPRSPSTNGTPAGGLSPGAGSSWGETPPPETDDPELADYSKETSTALHSLSPGNASIDVAFPAGGARGLEGGAGARLILPASMALSFALLAGIDKESDKNAVGGALRIQGFLGSSTRAFPYAFVGLDAGKNGGGGNAPSDDFEAGASLGFGVEVFLLKEISTSAEVGVASRVMPGDALRLATGTSQIALHYFFGE